MKKKIFALATAGALSAALLGGCGGSVANGNAGQAAAETESTAAEAGAQESGESEAGAQDSAATEAGAQESSAAEADAADSSDGAEKADASGAADAQDSKGAEEGKDPGASSGKTLTEDEIKEQLPEGISEEAGTVDIGGCDTFTQIVDKLKSGQGYANANIGGVDVLLVAEATYDNMDGNKAAIDAEVFYYKDGKPEYMGKLNCGGTAYPLALKDGLIYVGSGHRMEKVTIENDKLTLKEDAWVAFDGEGNETYGHTEGEKLIFTDSAAEEKRFGDTFGELESAEVINFDTIK
ncbi:MAG: hypothetical protein J6O55_03465 [Lachnospiraceae bacterium]|nr:hypothetical protein [Lachnospiraceae bacterium]